MKIPWAMPEFGKICAATALACFFFWPEMLFAQDGSGAGGGGVFWIFVKYLSAGALILSVFSIAYILRKWKRKADRLRAAREHEEMIERGERRMQGEADGQEFSALRDVDPETGRVTYDMHPVSSSPTEVGTFSYLLMVGGVLSLMPVFGLPLAIAVLLLAPLAARKFRPSFERTVGLKLIFWSVAMAGTGAAASLLSSLTRLRAGLEPGMTMESEFVPGHVPPIYFPFILLGVLVFSVVMHESAHGLVAYWCGDPTAKKAGRLTLNPLKHFDLFGSFILPALLFLTTKVALGYAKPVPIDMNRFGRQKRDRIFASTAGVTANILCAFASLCILAALAFWLKLAWPHARISGFSKLLQPPVFEGVPFPLLWTLAVQALKSCFIVNFVLGFFNMIPVPPLDGSYVLESVLPKNMRLYFRILRVFGFPIMVVILVLLMFSGAFAFMFSLILKSSSIIEIVTHIQ